MGLLLELAEILAGVAVALTAGSSLSDYLKARHHRTAPSSGHLNNLQTVGKNASVTVTLPGKKSVHLEMPTEEAERLVQR